MILAVTCRKKGSDGYDRQRCKFNFIIGKVKCYLTPFDSLLVLSILRELDFMLATKIRATSFLASHVRSVLPDHIGDVGNMELRFDNLNSGHLSDQKTSWGLYGYPVRWVLDAYGAANRAKSLRGLLANPERLLGGRLGRPFGPVYGAYTSP